MLGNDTGTSGAIRVFSETAGSLPAQIVSAPIATRTDGRGVLRIRDFDYTFQGVIGQPATTAPTARKLSTVRIDNARTTFGANINANAVTLNPNAELVLSDNLTISNTLTLNNQVGAGSTATTGGATLALGQPYADGQRRGQLH